MNLLDDMEAPDYAFQSLMEWAQVCYINGFDFNPSMTHKANFTWMYKSIHNSKHMLPHLEKITLPDPLPSMSTIDVICYDIFVQLLSILQDKSIMTRETWCWIRMIHWPCLSLKMVVLERHCLGLFTAICMQSWLQTQQGNC